MENNISLISDLIYFEGQPVKEVSDVSVEDPECYDERRVLGVDVSNGPDLTATCSVRFSRNDFLSIVYGRRITNNWLKMHGGVMHRRRKEK